MARKLLAVWVAVRGDDKDWDFSTYGTRAEAVARARLLTGIPNAEHKWRAVRFVPVAQRHSKESDGK